MPALPGAHRLPHRGDHRDALPAGRGAAHRRHLGLHRAPGARAAREAPGFALSSREDREDPRAEARPGARLLRPAGRHRARPREGRPNVVIFNQRSVEEILTMIRLLAVDGRRSRQGRSAGRGLEASLARSGRTQKRSRRRPRVYFEEWDEPMISAIRWVSELIEIAGGEDVFAELSLSQGGDRPDDRRSAEVVRRSPTSSSARGAARSSGRSGWPRGRAGTRYRR